MSRTLILGAGITGIMAKCLMDEATVLEAGREGSSTFKTGANYLWKDIPLFRTHKVKIFTSIDERWPDSSSILRYKNKIGKSLEDREMWGEQFKPTMNGYLICDVPYIRALYNTRVAKINLKEKTFDYVGRHTQGEIKFDTLISTIPLPVLVMLAGLETEEMISKWFKYRPIYVKETKCIPSSSRYVSVNYISSRSTPTYRITKYFEEGAEHEESLRNFIPSPDSKIKTLFPGKIWESLETREVLKTLSAHGVYCFGRYASWNPDELIHQTYEKLVNFKKERTYAIR